MRVADRAEVAELVDALGSGSSVGFHVGVRISPSAPKIIKSCNPNGLQLLYLLVAKKLQKILLKGQ